MAGDTQEIADVADAITKSTMQIEDFMVCDLASSRVECRYNCVTVYTPEIPRSTAHRAFCGTLSCFRSAQPTTNAGLSRKECSTSRQLTSG